MTHSVNELVRNQILAEGPDLPSAWDGVGGQDGYNQFIDAYVDETLNAMTNVELLERISDALKGL